MTVLELKQKRAEVTASIRAYMDKFADAEMSVDDQATLATMEAEFDKFNNKISTEEKQIARERAMGEAQEPAAQVAPSAKLEAFRNHLIMGNSETLRAYNALSMDNPTQAGYLVAPEQFVSELIKGVDDMTFIRKKAKVLPPLKNAHSLGYPTRTARMGAAVWGTELAAPTADTSLAFGKKEFKPNPATAEILLSDTLVRNYPGADSLIRDEFSYVFASLEETAYMTGDGIGKPLGLFVASVDGIPASRDISTGNTATEMKVDGLLEAKYSVKEQYQANSEWIFNRVGVKQLAKLKNSDGQYVWQPSIILGTPDLLLGKPVNSSEFVPSTFTTGLYVGLYGDLKYYWIVDSLALRIQVLTELYARTNQIDYIARLETDAQPVLAEAFARVKLG